jgi:hypothetical protein
MARSNNNNKLKAFVRFDGSGRIVPSSLIVQAFKPKVGNYKEIDAKECCNPTRVVITDTIPGEFPLTYVSVRLFCDESTVQTEYTSEGAANMSELITLLNTDPNLSVFGTYVALNETTVQLTVNYSIENNLCPDGVLSFNIFED